VPQIVQADIGQPEPLHEARMCPTQVGVRKRLTGARAEHEVDILPVLAGGQTLLKLECAMSALR
jgi:hypothetical protein